jgi:thiamine-phosphate pyrophosphorylase
MNHAAYRIIDANFNRAREACRLVEEFCRFVLNSKSLTERAKKLRHELSTTIGSIDSNLLLAGRDTKSDVGAGETVQNQMGRENLIDCFTAACKRLGEALRVLAEILQTIDASRAGKIEQLRFEAYELEKDASLFFNTAERFKPVKLYVIINSDLPAEIIRLTQSCIAGGADCIQLRAKNIDTDTLFAIAGEFVGICKEHNVPAIINDRVDIAAASDADGVHLGQNDLPIEQVRKLQHRPLIIGRSTHCMAELEKALKQLPTYVSLGPVFATDTKADLQPVGLEYVREGTEFLKDTGVRGVAIGGITAKNVADVLKAGASTVAVCSAIAKAEDSTSACRVLKQQIVDFQK